MTAATKLFPELRIIPGFALDMTTTDIDGQLWDFDSKVMRDRAIKKIREERPLLFIGSSFVQHSVHGEGSMIRSDAQSPLQLRSVERSNT